LGDHGFQSVIREFVLTKLSREEPAFVLTPFQVDDVRPTDIGLCEDH
jgi:hypothetical protein